MIEIERKDIYQRTRDDLLKRQLSNDENLDRSILTLASAALALSVAFLRYTPNPTSFGLLVVAWIGFVTAIIATIASYITSQLAIKRQLQLAERYYLENDAGAIDAPNYNAKITEWLTFAASGLFVFGIIMMLWFFTFNLRSNTEEKMSNDQSRRLQEGASLPDLQKIEGGASVPRMQIAPTEERGASIPPMQPVHQPAQRPTATTTQPPSKPTPGDGS